MSVAEVLGGGSTLGAEAAKMTASNGMSNPNFMLENRAGADRPRKDCQLTRDYEAFCAARNAKWQKRFETRINTVQEPVGRLPGQSNLERRLAPQPAGPANETPVDSQGIPWSCKRSLPDPAAAHAAENANKPVVFSTIRRFSGEQTRTFSHTDLVMPTLKTVQREARDGFSYTDICDEWERQCLRPRGPPLVSHEEAFRVDKLRGKGEGTGEFFWCNPQRTSPTATAGPAAASAAPANQDPRDARVEQLEAQVTQLDRARRAQTGSANRNIT